MEEHNPRGNTILYIILQLANFLIGLFGLALLILGIYMWINIKNFNSFVFSFIILFIILSCIFVLGCYTKFSPTTLIIYIVLNSLITIVIIIFTIYLYLDKEKIIDYITSKMDSSKDEIKEKFNKNLDIIKLLFLTFTLVFVL